jgi:hypothetical protein
MKKGPKEYTDYYTYDTVHSKYVLYDFGEKKEFNFDLVYYTIHIDELSEVQVFKRSTKTGSEGAYKLSRVSSIEGIESDHDFYRILTLSEKAMGPQRGEKYYIYDDWERKYKLAEEMEYFDENTDYYHETYDRRHFGLYNVANDKYPDLYVFVPDDKGDYVHIIRKETVETVDVKWY